MTQTIRERILSVALDIAISDGLRGVTRDRVATLASISTGAVNHCYGTMDDLRDAVVRIALTDIDPGTSRIVAEAIIYRMPVATGLSQAVRRRVLAAVLL